MVSQNGVIFSMLSVLNAKFLSGSRGPHRPDLLLLCGQKFQFLVLSLRVKGLELEDVIAFM